jgi:hypothetical protein
MENLLNHKRQTISGNSWEEERLKAKYYISVVALVVGILGLFTGQMLAQPAHYTVGGTNYYIEVEEPFVVTADPPRGEFKLFPGEETTITFTVRNKNDALDYSAVFVYWVESSGMLSVDDVEVTWAGIDDYTTLEGHGVQEYPWVLVPMAANRGEPGNAKIVTVTIKLAPTAPSGLYTMHFLIKRTEALLALTWSADALLYNSTVLPCVIDNAIKVGMPSAYRNKAICIVYQGAMVLASKTDKVVDPFDLRVALVYYLVNKLGMTCEMAYNLEKGIGVPGGTDCLAGTKLSDLNCSKITAYISDNAALCEEAITKATTKCP